KQPNIWTFAQAFGGWNSDWIARSSQVHRPHKFEHLLAQKIGPRLHRQSSERAIPVALARDSARQKVRVCPHSHRLTGVGRSTEKFAPTRQVLGNPGSPPIYVAEREQGVRILRAGMVLDDLQRFRDLAGLEQRVSLSERRNRLLHAAGMASHTAAFHL